MFLLAVGGGRQRALHRWHTACGAKLNEEMMKIFKGKVVGFPTLMEVIR